MTVRAVAGQRLDVDKATDTLLIALRPTVAAHLPLDARLQPTVAASIVVASMRKQAELLSDKRVPCV